MKQYFAEDNVVYDEDGLVMVVVANVGFRKWVAKRMARFIADHMTEYEYESADVLTGSVH